MSPLQEFRDIKLKGFSEEQKDIICSKCFMEATNEIHDYLKVLYTLTDGKYGRIYFELIETILYTVACDSNKDLKGTVAGQMKKEDVSNVQIIMKSFLIKLNRFCDENLDTVQKEIEIFNEIASKKEEELNKQENYKQGL